MMQTYYRTVSEVRGLQWVSSGLKSVCWRDCIPSRGSRGECISLPFPAFRECPHSLAWGPLPAWKPTMASLDSNLLPPCSTFNGPLWWHWTPWIIQDNLFIFEAVPSSTLITPCHVMEPIYRFQALGRGHLWLGRRAGESNYFTYLLLLTVDTLTEISSPTPCHVILFLSPSGQMLVGCLDGHKWWVTRNSTQDWFSLVG